MDPSDIAKYKALYIQTAREYIKELNDNLNTLMQGNETTDAVSSVHRAAHSLGSQSQVMGYESTQVACRTIEKLFKAKKETNITITPDTYSLVTALVKEIEQSINTIETTGKELDLSESTKILEAAIEK